MEKKLKKILLTAAVLSAVMLASCSKENDSSSSSGAGSVKTISAIKAESIPASGAKKFIKDDSYIISAAKSISSAKSDSLIDFIENSFGNLLSEVHNNTNIYLAKARTASQYRRAFERSEYLKKLALSVQDFQEDAQQAFMDLQKKGNTNFEWSTAPGKATDLPEGMMINIPGIKVAAKVKRDPNNNSGLIKGSGYGQISTKIDGLSFSIDNASADVSVSGSDKNINGNFSAGISASLALDPAEFEIDDSMLKYFSIKASAGTDGAFKGTSMPPENFNAAVKVSLSSALSFAAPNGVGGKAILTFNFSSKENNDAVSKMTDNSSVLEDLKEGKEVSKADFEKLFDGINISLSIKFYDDDNKETYAFLDAKNTYELYQQLMEFSDKYELNDEINEAFGSKKKSYDYDDYSYGYDDYSYNYDYDYDYGF